LFGGSTSSIMDFVRFVGQKSTEMGLGLGFTCEMDV